MGNGHLRMNLNGAIVGFSLPATSVSECEMLRELTTRIKDTILGDKGYLGQSFVRSCLPGASYY